MELDLNSGGTLVGYTLFGGTLGRGVAMLAANPATEDAQRRLDAAATLTGAALGTVGAVVLERYQPLESTDVVAASVGGGYGAFLGSLLPSLGSTTWPGFTRQTGGGILTGMSAGVIGGALLRRNTGVPQSTVGLAALGGLDGMGMGLGVGLLVAPDNGATSQPERIGATVGTVAGVTLGALAWPRVELTPSRSKLIRNATLISSWTGLWLPATAYTSIGDGFSNHALGRRMLGGVLAGAGAGSIVSSLAASSFELDDDALDDAAAGYLIWSGAGAGAGALFFQDDNAPVIGMLGAGTTGMVAYGLLHERIDFGDSAPLSAALGVQLGWLGFWTSTLVQPGEAPFDRVTGRQIFGGTAAGALAGVGAAALLQHSVPMDRNTASMSLLGSGIASSIGGGVTLLADSLHNKTGVGVLMGLSSLGFVGGAFAAKEVELSPAAMGGMAGGAALGIAEGLTFAWAGEAGSGADYVGAALIGGGVGSALGLSAGATSNGGNSVAPAAAGFGAWGAWIGSFAGSLAYKDGGPDSHRVTMGGLIGANAGFGLGFLMLETEVVQPRDIGWISAFGGIGTLAGAGVGAIASSKDNPAPILAGLAIGPVVGMGAGAIIWPRVRGSVSSEPEKTAFLTDDEPVGTGFASALRITEWQPLMGALPARDGSGESTMVMGAQGKLW